MPRVIVCLLVALAAATWLGLAAPAAPAAPAAGAARLAWCGGNDRVMTNRVPDIQVPSPYQVHVVYATPSDGPDNFAADASPIADDVAAIDAWWRGQDPTRTLRFDLYPFPGCGPGFGQLDLSFVRLPQPGSAYMDSSARLDALTTDLGALASDDQVKTLVYYDGPVLDDNICGTSEYQAQARGGRFGLTFVWLQACSPDLGQGGQTARVAAHELLHDLGAVPNPGPPHECLPPEQGHVCDSEADILFPRVHAGVTLATAVLDVGRDDYYGHSGSWWDIQDSQWLEHLPLRPLTVAVSGGGSVLSSPKALSCPPACTVNADDGSTIALAAAPAAGRRLVRWSGACSGPDACVVTMDGDKNVTAVFGPASFRLAVAVSGRGSVAGAGPACRARCTRSLPAGAKTVLRAIPAKAYRFAGWSGDCRGTGACVLRGDRAHAVTARFVRR